MAEQIKTKYKLSFETPSGVFIELEGYNLENLESLKELILTGY